jgi:large repetitive protein
MFNRRRLPLVAAVACLVLVSSAAAAPEDNKFTASSTPSVVKPAPVAPTYTVTLTNDPAPSGDADRATIDPPEDFDVLGTPVATVSGCGNVQPWTVTVLADETVSAVRSGGSANNLCPGGTLTVVLSARAAVADGDYQWAAELRHGVDPLEPPFTLHDAQLSIRVDGTPPTVDIGETPSSLSNSRLAHFTFTASDPTQCKLDDDPPTPCVSAADYDDLGNGPHTFAVTATDAAGNTAQDSYAWVVDATPPQTSITSLGPPAVTNSTSASFTFASTEPGTFECSRDGEPFAVCESPRSYTGLPGGSRTFQVRATDTAGNTDPTPASRAWIIDLTGPATTISQATPSLTNSTNASFTFQSIEPNTTFACSLDGALFTACESPVAYNNLPDGSHTFAVRAIDSHTNTGPAALHTWTVDTGPPTATLASGPSALSNSRSATFTFFAGEPSSFQCSLDGGGFVPCSSPASYAGLGDGGHTFVVRPTDVVGNAGAASSYVWTIDATAPETILGSRPRSGTTAVSATFTFSASEAANFQCKLDAAAFAPCGSPKRYARLRRSGHTFALRAIDAAGNVDATPAVHRWAIGAAPRRARAASALLAPRAGARVTSPPVLRWRRVARASYYNVQLYRGRVKVLSAWPTSPRLQLGGQWRFLGRQRRLTRGTYRWLVWPRFGRRYGALLGQRTFTVVARR